MLGAISRYEDVGHFDATLSMKAAQPVAAAAVSSIIWALSENKRWPPRTFYLVQLARSALDQIFVTTN